MINSEELNELTQEVQDNGERKIEKIEKKSELSWGFIQICICLVIVGTVLFLKELSPENYEYLKEKYSQYIEQTLLIENGEINFIDENANSAR
ncbi:MAG: hypothetical protein R3Y33_00570 [Clostridia bacterium]